jgi:hypothetical protein
MTAYLGPDPWLDEGEVPAWASPHGNVDHLYPTCPILIRLGDGRLLQTGVDPDDPYGLCGWCLRQWKRGKRP